MTAVVLRGDARALPLPDASVDLIVTSPPYWALRDYRDGDESMAGQIGSEPTWQEWLANLVDCTREWMRVLKPSGNMFVNLADKFSTGNSGQSGMAELGQRWAGGGHTDAKAKRRSAAVSGMSPKCLLLLPERYAIACTDQLGLILRRDIIWSKPNGLPESVTDRCRSSHEYLFHLVRQPRYYAAVDEIREAHTAGHLQQQLSPQREMGRRVLPKQGYHDYLNPLGKLPGSVWSIPSQPLTVPAHLGTDHFAAFPMELPRRCILGWSPPGICTACGEGRRPVVDRQHEINRRTVNDSRPRGYPHDRRTDYSNSNRLRELATITGYACACGSDVSPPEMLHPTGIGRSERAAGWGHLPPTRPAVVVDPFGGTGTTALVASVLGRTGVSIDRSADYCRLARWRCTDPAERARAMQVPKPPPVPAGQVSLFDLDAS